MERFFDFISPPLLTGSLILLTLLTTQLSNIYCGQNQNQPISQQDTVTSQQRTRQQTYMANLKQRAIVEASDELQNLL